MCSHLQVQGKSQLTTELDHVREARSLDRREWGTGLVIERQCKHCVLTLMYRILVYTFVTVKQTNSKRTNEKKEGQVIKILSAHCASNPSTFLFYFFSLPTFTLSAKDSDLFLLDSWLHYTRRILPLSWQQDIIYYSHSSKRL